MEPSASIERSGANKIYSDTTAAPRLTKTIAPSSAEPHCSSDDYFAGTGKSVGQTSIVGFERARDVQVTDGSF